MKDRIGEKLRYIVHPLVINVLSARRSFKLEITGDVPKGQQFIFVANHYCIDDIPTTGEVIGNHVYALVSDEDRGTLNGLALDLNGVVWTNRLDKAKRKHAKGALIRHLDNLIPYRKNAFLLRRRMGDGVYNETRKCFLH